MADRPILFSAPMVRAILDGRKTQTRRIVKPGRDPYVGCQMAPCEIAGDINNGNFAIAPYGQPGDRLWVREPFCPIYPQDPHYNGGQPIAYDYAATYQHGDRIGDYIGERKVWKRSIRMPRAASRITLEITAVRVERLHDISYEDALAEGVFDARPLLEIGQSPETSETPDEISRRRRWPQREYAILWDTINGPQSWDKNPLVWVIDFKRI